METLLDFRESVKDFYGKYDAYIVSGWKFLPALLSFWFINGRLGYFEKLNSIFVVLILALFCSFLPINGIVLVGASLILIHLYGLSLPAFIVGGGILVIFLLVYFSVTPREGYAFVLTMLALELGIPCTVPLVFGLISTPAAAAAMCFGIISYYMLGSVAGATEAAASGKTSLAEESQELIKNIKTLLESIIKDDRLVLALISMVAVLLVVYLIRRMAVKYSWTMAIVIGTLTFLLVELTGCLVFDRMGEALGLLIGTAFAVLIAFIVKFFVFRVDYSKVVNVQFEDGDYYYYVKAVPKVKKGREERGDN